MNSNPPTILVVDDEAHILHVVSLKLRNAGFAVVTADNGEEGLEACLAHQPDLIITDYQMPLMSGLEMSTALKADERTAHIPALMLTARGFSIPAESLAKTNIVSVLSKPFSPREVLQKVQDMLGQLKEGAIRAS